MAQGCEALGQTLPLSLLTWEAWAVQLAQHLGHADGFPHHQELRWCDVNAQQL